MPADSPEASKPLHGPNQWPEEHLVPGLRATYTEYYEALKALGMRLLGLLALALDLPPEHFFPYFQPEPMVMLRPLHYQGRISAPERGIYGAGDYGSRSAAVCGTKIKTRILVDMASVHAMWV